MGRRYADKENAMPRIKYVVAWLEGLRRHTRVGRVLPVQAKQELKQSKTRQNKEIVWLGTFHISLRIIQCIYSGTRKGRPKRRTRDALALPHSFTRAVSAPAYNKELGSSSICSTHVM